MDLFPLSRRYRPAIIKKYCGKPNIVKQCCCINVLYMLKFYTLVHLLENDIIPVVEDVSKLIESVVVLFVVVAGTVATVDKANETHIDAL